jgi:hypothetical protein
MVGELEMHENDEERKPLQSEYEPLAESQSKF